MTHPVTPYSTSHTEIRYGNPIGPRPVNVKLMPTALLRFSRKYEFSASEKADTASPTPAAAVDAFD